MNKHLVHWNLLSPIIVLRWDFTDMSESVRMYLSPQIQNVKSGRFLSFVVYDGFPVKCEKTKLSVERSGDRLLFQRFHWTFWRVLDPFCCRNIS